MHKKTIIAVTACILGIVLLAGLAFLIPGTRSGPGGFLSELLGRGSIKETEESELFTGFVFQTEEEMKAPVQDTDSSVTPETAVSHTEPDRTDQSETESEQSVSAEKHRIIFVGDSRTLGMRDALRRTDRADNDVFVGRVGEGVRWFREDGMDEMSQAIAANPDLPVVLNLGVNDPKEIDDYIVTYWDCVREHPDTKFYILSVNPLDEEFLIDSETAEEEVLDTVNNLNVAKLNIRLKEEFEDRYLDSASFLKADGFETVDGLHYTAETYLKIHDFVVDQLF